MREELLRIGLGQLDITELQAALEEDAGEVAGELGPATRSNVFTALNAIDCSLELMAALEPGGVLHTVSA